MLAPAATALERLATESESDAERSQPDTAGHSSSGSAGLALALTQGALGAKVRVVGIGFDSHQPDFRVVPFKVSYQSVIVVSMCVYISFLICYFCLRCIRFRRRQKCVLKRGTLAIHPHSPQTSS